MTDVNRGPTHRRLLVGYLVSIVAIVAVTFGVMFVAATIWTREFGLFLFGAGVFVSCLGLSHSHTLKCSRIELDPDSKPGPLLWIVPLLLVAGMLASLVLHANDIPRTPLARGATAAAALGVTWALLRGGRAIHRIAPTAR